MRKKANIQMVMILVVAILLVITAWMIFLTSDKNFGNRSRDYSYLISGIDFNEEYAKSEASLIAYETVAENLQDISTLKSKYQEIALKHGLDIEAEGNFFGKIRNGEFIFEKVGEDYVMEIKDVNVQSKIGNNQIKRIFDINIKIPAPSKSA